VSSVVLTLILFGSLAAIVGIILARIAWEGGNDQGPWVDSEVERLAQRRRAQNDALSGLLWYASQGIEMMHNVASIDQSATNTNVIDGEFSVRNDRRSA
jgi:hypothetical protein